VPDLDGAEAGAVHDLVAGGVLPMLAHSYQKRSHTMRFPCAVQPKLDGHRCVAVVNGDGSVDLWSRTRKRITGTPHVARAIEALSLPPGTVLDGELYHHGYRDNFEELTSFIRQETPRRGHEVVEYHVYDMVLRDGFVDLPYEHKRSDQLLKVKLMEDAEFEVVGVEEGRGRMAGLAIFACKTAAGEPFTVKMEGPLESLRPYWEDHSLAVGRMLTVRYQNMTQAGVPRFPVGVRFREDA
jgi:ATP-dependent DNA ligase